MWVWRSTWEPSSRLLSLRWKAFTVPNPTAASSRFMVARYSCASTQRVAGGEDVARIEADPQAVRVLDAVEDRRRCSNRPPSDVP